MTEENYKPGDRLHYREEHGSFEVEVVRDISDTDDVGYRFKVVRTISPAARGFRMAQGHEFDWRNPRNPQFTGAFGEMGGYLQGRMRDSD